MIIVRNADIFSFLLSKGAEYENDVFIDRFKPITFFYTRY